MGAFDAGDENHCGCDGEQCAVAVEGMDHDGGEGRGGGLRDVDRDVVDAEVLRGASPPIRPDVDGERVPTGEVEPGGESLDDGEARHRAGRGTEERAS